MTNILYTLSLWVLVLSVAACTTTTPLTSNEGRVGVPTEVLGQNALPPGASIKPELSLIMGAGEQWVGRVVADLGEDDGRWIAEVSTLPGATSLVVISA